MVESTIDKIKDITVERQIRKLAGIIDEQNDTISKYGDASSEIEVLKTSDAKQTADINNLNNTVAPIPAQIQSLIDTDANQATQINNLKQSIATDKLATEAAITELQSKDASQDGTLTNHATLIQGITESLVSDVEILTGTTTGQIKVRIGRESVAAIDSNSYDLGLPVSAEIIQGTGPSMFKVQITMSSGVKVISNDFVFTTEAIGTDVYISSFTFKAGNQDGYLSADIGLNNGVTIEANNFLVPTDPSVLSTIADLQNRLTTVESTSIPDSRITAIEDKNTEQDTKISELETKNTSQDTAIQKNARDISSLNTEVSGIMSDLGTKADLTNPSQTIKADTTDLRTVKLRDSSDAVSTYLQFNASGDKPVRMEYFNGSEVVDSGYVATVDGSGNPKNFTIPSSGEVWEEVDLNNWPTDWVSNDRIKMLINVSGYASGVRSWTTAILSSNITFKNEGKNGIIEFKLHDGNGYQYPLIPIEIRLFGESINILLLGGLLGIDAWNSLSNLNDIGYLQVLSFNGAGQTSKSQELTLAYLKSNVKMWRLKK